MAQIPGIKLKRPVWLMPRKCGAMVKLWQGFRAFRREPKGRTEPAAAQIRKGSADVSYGAAGVGRVRRLHNRPAGP